MTCVARRGEKETGWQNELLISPLTCVICMASNSCVENYSAVMSLDQGNYTPYPVAVRINQEHTHTHTPCHRITLHAIAHLLAFNLLEIIHNSHQYLGTLDTKLFTHRKSWIFSSAQISLEFTLMWTCSVPVEHRNARKNHSSVTLVFESACTHPHWCQSSVWLQLAQQIPYMVYIYVSHLAGETV